MTTSSAPNTFGKALRNVHGRLRIAVVLAVLLVSIGGATLAQSFGSGSQFEGEALFGPQSTAGDAEEDPRSSTSVPYFSHDQGLKLVLLLVFMIGGGVLAVLGRLLLRRLYLVAVVAVLGLYMGGYLCPTAAVQNIFLKADTAYLLLFLVPILGALLMGRLFCGYVCPFGALQELFHVRRWAMQVPAKVMRVLGWLRYVALVYLVARVLVTHVVVLDEFSPFKPLFTWGGTPATIAFTTVAALFSVVLFRPFCRVLCPYGALLSLASRISFLRLNASQDCRGCNACTRACPAEAMQGGAVDTAECLLCGACGEQCGPRALRLSFRWRRKKATADCDG